MRKSRVLLALLTTGLAAVAFAVTAGTAAATAPLKPTVGTAAAFAESKPLRDLKPLAPGTTQAATFGDRGSGPVGNTKHQGDAALQTQVATSAMPTPLFTFEGPSNVDNRSIFPQFPFGVNPPDPVGDVGMQNYVAMVNLTFSIYTKTGTLLYGPAATGTLWQGFPIEECTAPAGDGIVVYDDIANRWILSQFSDTGADEFWNCVAVSQTQDPLGAYNLYAFPTGEFFPDYPKYGIMGKGLYITTREFGPAGEYQIGVYAINRLEIEAGDPDPTVVAFYLVDGVDPLYLLGDGILPADQDGSRMPPVGSPAYFAGTMDDNAFYGAPDDAINFFTANVDWANPDNSTFGLQKSIPTADFDSIFPCGPNSRDCLPQPGIVDPAQYLDILSYRQRPTYRLQYRNFGDHESLVTNQSVEALPGVAGVRWYEIRNPTDAEIYQQGTYAPGDGIHRWMGSVALDKQGNMAVGYSVVNATSVFPGIRYAGRLAGDPLSTLPQAEAILRNGAGVQTTTNSRWGDYTSMNIDPQDDCTFYYINEYYQVSGVPPPAMPGQMTAPWQTRIGAFKFPGCKPGKS
jgi:hypothetical protein